MNETLQKWNYEFNISDSNKEPTLFLLLKDYLDSYNKHKSNHIIDEQNRIIIDKIDKNDFIGLIACSSKINIADIKLKNNEFKE